MTAENVVFGLRVLAVLCVLWSAVWLIAAIPPLRRARRILKEIKRDG